MSAASLDDLGMDRGLASAVYRHEDFPGCELFHLPAGEVDRYEDRLEFWDGVTETAWKVCEPTSIQHEGPSRRLVQMATRLHSESARAQAKGHAHGQREGRAQGLREGRAQGRMELVAAALRAGGIEAALHLPENRELFSGLSGEALMAAALACTGEADFRRRIREQRGMHAELPPSPDPEE